MHGIPRIVNNILSSKSSTEDLKKWRRVSPFKKIEQFLLILLKSAKSQNVPISSSILREKTLQIITELGEFIFSASNEWLQRFILQHDLTFKKVCGEAADVNDKEWKES